ncbi:hypothetical protein VNI00_008953 [Paramarasmius palmivorus]|uniref:BTB domain-containing protein n=1 Tax=Paramarasmius palmivorus TaxID=297713 RepID=A0AAW0CRR7_9AGAR
MDSDSVLDDRTNLLPSHTGDHGSPGDSVVIRGMQAATEAMGAVNPLRPFSYREGREFEFKILVKGVDCDFEAPASLLCVTSGYFSDLARTATEDTYCFDYVQIDVAHYDRDVVSTVLELIYRLDIPEGVLGQIVSGCKSEKLLERTSALTHALNVLRLAHEWRVPKIKRLLQMSLCADGLIPISDLEYGERYFCIRLGRRSVEFKVRNVADSANAFILVKHCDEVGQRVNKLLRGM